MNIESTANLTKRCGLLAFTLALLAWDSLAHGAPVTWSAPTTITADADVSTTGTGVFAYNWKGASQTVNGVVFTAPGSGVSLSGGSVNGTYPFSNPNGASISTAYQAILPGAYAENATAPHTLTVVLNNLTVGHPYQVQWWAEDSRSLAFGRNTILTSSGGNTVTLQLNTASGNNGTGQYCIGTFTADATTQTITATANTESHLNALQLRDLSMVSAPAFNPPAGIYQEAQTVTLTSDAGSTIHYTTDGTPPNITSPSGAAASGAATVSVPASQTLKAYATKSGRVDSATATAAYVITLVTPTFNPPPGTYQGAQTITLASDAGSTVYYTTDGTLPGPASAHGGDGTGTATVSVASPGSVLISAIASQAGHPDSPLGTGYYRTVSHPGDAAVFTGPRREGANKDGVIKNRWGVEQTMLFEDGIYKSWYHGGPDATGDYWNTGVIRYATSPDGITWTDLGICLGSNRGCPFVYHLKAATAAGDPAGYYMTVGRNGQFGFDLFYSATGLPGSWNWLNNSNLILSMGRAGSWDSFRTGNINIWYENNQWQVLYEACASSGAWQTGRAYGPSLTNLTKYPANPVIKYNGPGSCVGGPEVVKVGHTYYCIFHETDPAINSTPTSCALYKSTDLNQWTRMGWMSREWVYKNDQAQVADASLFSRNGKTWMWYEDVQYQNPQLPELSLMTWDMPFEELVNRPEYWDDTQAGGWVFDAGFGEILTTPGNWPSTYFRKISNPIPPNCLVLKTDATHQLRVRKALGISNQVFRFSARAEQTTVKFTPLRLDADANNTILAGVIFDSDGKIKYYQNAVLTTARAYVAGTTYTFAIECAPGGYSLSIDGKRVASDTPYASPYVVPAYCKIEQAAGGTSYVGTAQSPAAARWSGAVNANWDTATANWIATGPPANQYADGDVVRFDDTAAGTGPVAVNVTIAASPGGILVDNATRNYLIGGSPITGTATLTKSGSGRLELAGANSYRGGTTVSGGTLAVSGILGGATAVSVGNGATLELAAQGRLDFQPAANGVVNTLTGIGTASLNGTFHIDLSQADKTPGNSWQLVDATALTDTYGPDFTVSGFSEVTPGSGVWTRNDAACTWTFDESTGKLTLPAGYTAWIGSFYPLGIDPAILAADADPDGDGVANGIEFLTGSNPLDASSGNSPSITRDAAGELVVAFRRVDAAKIHQVAVEYGTTLQPPWTPITVPNNAMAGPPVTVVEHGTDPDDITVVIPANGDARKFARLRMTVEP